MAAAANLTAKEFIGFIVKSALQRYKSTKHKKTS
jgi:uncharacterized protein (DUF1778 family)